MAISGHKLAKQLFRYVQVTDALTITPIRCESRHNNNEVVTSV